MKDPKTMTYDEMRKFEKMKHPFEVGVEHVIGQHFTDPWLFHVTTETRRFTKEIEEIWNQDKGKTDLIAEVYYNGEYVCDISERMNPKQVIDRIKFAISMKPNLKMVKENSGLGLFGPDGLPL